MAELFQAIGSRALYITANEATWGVVNPSPAFRKVRLLPGESIDRNQSLLRSSEIRDDRMKTATVFGDIDPGGSVPFELSPGGWNPWFYHLLGGSVVTTTAAGNTLAGAPAAPSGAASGTGGTLATATYAYKMTALNAFGETLPSVASSGASVTGPTGKVTLTWSPVSGATGYKIYGRTGAAFNLIAVVGAVTTYVDTGAVTPNSSFPAPIFDTSGYQHVIKGSVDLPVGFSLEKGFLDIPRYLSYLGCRVNRLSLNLNHNRIVTGSWDFLAQDEPADSATSINSGALQIYRPTDQAYSSPQVSILEGLSLTSMGNVRDCALGVDNGMVPDKGHILGTNLKQNLKPGDRTTTFGGTFMFNSMSLYNKATAGTSTAIRALISNGTSSLQVDLPNFRFLPQNTTPKANDSGQIEIRATGEALPDLVTGTDIIVTLIVPEASITA